MRPLLVDLGRDFRGGQHQALLLLEGLLARGHSPELIAVSDSLLVKHAQDAGIPVRGVAPGCRRLSAALQIWRKVRSESIDVVHANEPHALSAAWLARAHRVVPVIAARRIAVALSSSSSSLARYRAAARIVAVSQFVAQSVAASGLPHTGIEVIYDGVAIPPAISAADRETARNRLGIPQESLCVGNVAAFVPEKGHALLVRAFAESLTLLPKGMRKTPLSVATIPARECFLLLRGAGRELSAIHELARHLQILDAIKFLPHDTNVETVFAATDIFAFPSHAEPLGSALLAAMAHAIPPVAFAQGGIPEVIEHGKNGLLVQDLDPHAFAAALVELMVKPEQATWLGGSARAAIVARFSVDRMVEETLDLYEKVRRTGQLTVKS